MRTLMVYGCPCEAAKCGEFNVCRNCRELQKNGQCPELAKRAAEQQATKQLESNAKKSSPPHDDGIYFGYMVRESATGRYDVKKPNGTIYHVKYCGSDDQDPEYFGLWECDCPSHRYNGECKHIRMVNQTVEYLDGNEWFLIEK